MNQVLKFKYWRFNLRLHCRAWKPKTKLFLFPFLHCFMTTRFYTKTSQCKCWTAAVSNFNNLRHKGHEAQLIASSISLCFFSTESFVSLNIIRCVHQTKLVQFFISKRQCLNKKTQTRQSRVVTIRFIIRSLIESKVKHKIRIKSGELISETSQNIQFNQNKSSRLEVPLAERMWKYWKWL